MWVHLSEKERERESVCVSKKERERDKFCVYLQKRERERELQQESYNETYLRRK